MTNYTVKLTGKKQIADGTTEFLMGKPADFKHRAGQFLDIILRGKSGDPKNNYIHGFSIIAAPHEDYIAIATRMRAESAFKQALNNLPDGSEVQLDASYGNFTLPKDTARPIIFIIGGIGVTPVRSMVAHATHEKTDHRLMLIHANRNRGNAPFVEDFEGFARDNPNFTFVKVYDDGAGDDGSEAGPITADLIRRHVTELVPEVKDAVYYLSGPPGMVRAMRSILMDDLKIDNDDIRTEEFDGY